MVLRATHFQTSEHVFNSTDSNLHYWTIRWKAQFDDKAEDEGSDDNHCKLHFNDFFNSKEVYKIAVASLILRLINAI